MNPFLKMINATRIVGAIILALGIAIFIYGMFVSDYVILLELVLEPLWVQYLSF